MMDLLEQEVPLRPPFPDIANWSENFCLASFDPDCGIGMWLHIGRWRKDLSLWREMVILTMPDGSVMSHRAFGNGRTAEDGPGGPSFAIRVVEKGRKLHYHYLGGSKVNTPEELRAGIMRDGPSERVELDLGFTSNADIWDLHKVGSSQKFLGTGHIEQIGKVSGTISVGRKSYRYDSMGNRDHSMGPRDNRTIHSHQWLQGYFDNGVSFLVYDAVVRGDSDPIFSEAVVYEGDRLYEGKLDYPWRCAHADDATRNFGFSIAYEKGRIDVRTTDIRNTAHLSYTSPNEQYVGVYPAGTPPLTLLEQSAILELGDGTRGFGNLERTVPGVVHIAE